MKFRTTVSAAELGEFVALILEDPNIPSRTREYAIAVCHELHMRGTAGVARRRSQELAGFPDVTRNADIWRDAAWLLNPTKDETAAWKAARYIIGDDAPRYEIPSTRRHPACVGTMLRPLGAPCTKRGSSVQASVPNPLTGERHMIGVCSNQRHRADFENQHKDAWDAWRLNGEPQPPNNTGGHLQRYFTYDWPALYAWAAPHRYKPDTPMKPLEEPRARLALVTDITTRRPE